MTTISTRTVKILAFVLTVLSGVIALVTSGAITLDVKVAEEVPAVEAPVEAEAPAEAPTEVPALTEPIPVPTETQVVDEAADAPASDVVVEASGG